ncbi:MAG: hypothetical protein AB8U44_02685 [Aaplasma endosymbiont of Hyalomma asiaticum]
MKFFKRIRGYFSSNPTSAASATGGLTTVADVSELKIKDSRRAVTATYVLIVITTIAALAVIAYFAYVNIVVAGLTTAILPHVFCAVGAVVSGVMLGLVVRQIDNNTRTVLQGIIEAKTEMIWKVLRNGRSIDDLRDKVAEHTEAEMQLYKIAERRAEEEAGKATKEPEAIAQSGGEGASQGQDQSTSLEGNQGRCTSDTLSAGAGSPPAETVGNGNGHQGEKSGDEEKDAEQGTAPNPQVKNPSLAGVALQPGLSA